MRPTLLGDEMFDAGNPNCGVLNRLNASQRNSSRLLSVKLKLRARAISKFVRPGPIRMPRPALPNVGWPEGVLGATKALASNQRLIERWSSSSLPSAIRLACGAAKEPTKPPFSPAVTE